MSWRTIVITGIAKLDYKLGFLVVRKKEEITRIHISEIRILLIESTSISLTTSLLAELIKQKVKVIFCDEKHNPCSELMSYYGSHDTSIKVKNQITWSRDIKEAVGTEIIIDKIKKQKLHLESLGFTESSDLLKHYLSEIKIPDEINREGHAARVYFNTLFGNEIIR